MRLNGLTALITGGARGLGAGIAERYAVEGAKVVINYNGSKEKAEALVASIKKNGGQAICIKADISQLDEVSVLVKQTVETFGGLDILVNNAGRAELSELSRITAEQVQKQFDLNVSGVIFATQQAVKYMKKGGRIINISSISAKGFAQGAVYGASKAAVNALTRSFATELGPRGITVNAIAPAALVTDMYYQTGLDKRMEANIAATPLGRVGQVEDVTGAAVFFASEDASWISGEILQVSGGRTGV